jgi:membrane AbrB-like protein
MATHPVLAGTLTLALGAAGGALFHTLHLPLPWMLGALAVVLAGAVLGLPVRLDERLRPPVIAVIGVLLGSGITLATLSQARVWAGSLVLLMAYTALAGVLGVLWYRRIAGFDRATAFFAGMPGGLVEMMLMARGRGADDRKVILAHAARIVVTVAAVAVWFRLIRGLPGTGPAAAGPLLSMPAGDAAVLVLAGLAGALAGRTLRLPAAMLTGPMLASAAVHLAGLTASAPPAALVVAAQVVLGSGMGARFRGTAAAEVARALALACGITAATLVLALACAAAVTALGGPGLAPSLLAFAPGGVTEMSLVALAIGADAAYVAMHHVLRIVAVIAAAPLAAPPPPPPDGT